jgi:hypothetical protein
MQQIQIVIEQADTPPISAEALLALLLGCPADDAAATLLRRMNPQPTTKGEQYAKR